MADGFIKKAYIALFDLLDKEYDKTSDNELGRLLSDMNPNTFVGDMSADSACYEDFCDFGKEYQKDDVLSAYSASMKFLKMYQDEFGFNIGKFIDTISFEKYKECFEKANIDS